MAIKWDEIRERGEAGLLTGAETDALVELAQIAAGESKRLYGGLCPACYHLDSFHTNNCPIAVLEKAMGIVKARRQR